MKAILVLDEMPTDCEDCPLFKDGDKGMRKCNAKRTGTEWDYYKVRPDWCPLKPIPEKKELYLDRIEYGYTLENMYSFGRNECIDEILGDKE